MRGFTLPIWVAAAAKAAAQILISNDFDNYQQIDFSNEQESITVPIRSAALLDNRSKSLGISFCEPGKGLDITRGLEIWVCLEFICDHNSSLNSSNSSLDSPLRIIPGHGVGKMSVTQEISISEFARELLIFNLRSFQKPGHYLKVEIIFPSGELLAEKTSNAAFGVVDGLALIGTQAEVQSSASPEQLTKTIQYLRSKCSEKSFSGFLTFVIGENGLDLAKKYGLKPPQIIKTGNWIGPLLVAAAEEGVNQLLLFGYHGKLIKLAGGVFHTHHHLADNRLDTLISLAVKEGIPIASIREFQNAVSVESALSILENKDIFSAKKLWKRFSIEVEKRSLEYVQRYVPSPIEIGAVMFDRNRKLRWYGDNARKIIQTVGLRLED